MSSKHWFYWSFFFGKFLTYSMPASRSLSVRFVRSKKLSLKSWSCVTEYYSTSLRTFGSVSEKFGSWKSRCAYCISKCLIHKKISNLIQINHLYKKVCLQILKLLHLVVCQTGLFSFDRTTRANMVFRSIELLHLTHSYDWK